MMMLYEGHVIQLLGNNYQKRIIPIKSLKLLFIRIHWTFRILDKVPGNMTFNSDEKFGLLKHVSYHLAQL